METAVIMDGDRMERALTRIAYEIIEKNKGLENLALIGIQRRGVVLAKRLAKRMESIEGCKLPVGVLDITFYRDDLGLLNEHPVINGTEIGFSIDGMKIVLIDDVLYTGRTVRSAIDELMDLGRPSMIQLAILVDRGHRELPFRADYIGKNVPTSKNEAIGVQVKEIDGCDRVVIQKPGRVLL